MQVRVTNADGSTALVPGWFTYVSSPPPNDDFTYYNRWIKDPGLLAAYSLREKWMLERRKDGGYAMGNDIPLSWTYEPALDPYPKKQDAAKLIIPNGGNSCRNQVRPPIPSHGTRSLTAVWDIYYGKEFLQEVHGIRTHKTWQFGSATSGNPMHVHTEVRMRYALAPPGAIGVLDGRIYDDCGPNVTNRDTLAPRVGTFVVWPERWSRIFAHMGAPDADGWWPYSLWAVDGKQAPVLIYDALQISPYPETNRWSVFYLEFNTSTTWEQSAHPNRPPLIAYQRNLMLFGGFGVQKVKTELISAENL